MNCDRQISSEEELLRLRSDGKISQSEYEELFEAMRRSGSEPVEAPRCMDPEFHAFRRRILIGGLSMCIVGLPLGLILKLPDATRVYVCVLSAVGIVVASIKLYRLKKRQ